jgi:hypothetical protein
MSVGAVCFVHHIHLILCGCAVPQQCFVVFLSSISVATALGGSVFFDESIFERLSCIILSTLMQYVIMLFLIACGLRVIVFG